MGVVTEKRLHELQTECELLRSTWIDPAQHEMVKKNLQMETESKQAYEVSTQLYIPQWAGCRQDICLI